MRERSRSSTNTYILRTNANGVWKHCREHGGEASGACNDDGTEFSVSLTRFSPSLFRPLDENEDEKASGLDRGEDYDDSLIENRKGNMTAGKCTNDARTRET